MHTYLNSLEPVTSRQKSKALPKWLFHISPRVSAHCKFVGRLTETISQKSEEWLAGQLNNFWRHYLELGLSLLFFVIQEVRALLGLHWRQFFTLATALPESQDTWLDELDRWDIDFLKEWPHKECGDLSISLSINPSVCLSVYLSVCLFLCLSVCLFVSLSICLWVADRKRERKIEGEESFTSVFCGTVKCHLSGRHLSEHVGYPTVGSTKYFWLVVQ